MFARHQEWNLNYEIADDTQSAMLAHTIMYTEDVDLLFF